jgi:hypothetical protein
VPTIPSKRRYGTDKADDKRKRRAVALEGRKAKECNVKVVKLC